MNLFTPRSQFDLLLEQVLGDMRCTLAAQCDTVIIDPGNDSYADQIDWQSHIYNTRIIPDGLPVSDLLRLVREGYITLRSEMSHLSDPWVDEFMMRWDIEDEPTVADYDEMRALSPSDPGYAKAQSDLRWHIINLLLACSEAQFEEFREPEDFLLTFAVTPSHLDLIEMAPLDIDDLPMVAVRMDSASDDYASYGNSFYSEVGD